MPFSLPFTVQLFVSIKFEDQNMMTVDQYIKGSMKGDPFDSSVNAFEVTATL